MVDTELLRELVETVVIVMMENRSFDHMLGHLSYEGYGNRNKVNGVRDPLTQYGNPYQDLIYHPDFCGDTLLYDIGDLPHEREHVAMQLGTSVNGAYPMDGFVSACSHYYRQCQKESDVGKFCFLPMGMLLPSDVPITTFLANKFAVCDKWFASLPASTHPNRCMALSGESPIDKTSNWDHGIQVDNLVLDWLDRNEVTWRVYHHDVVSSFFMFSVDRVANPEFRRFGRLQEDYQNKGDGFPSVIFIEPSYGALSISPTQNDNHPPVSVSGGEDFLRQIYQILTSDQERWRKTVMILTYDEHGGFFDHVSPLTIPYSPPPGAMYTRPFETTGVRVPAIVASPLVSPGRVCSAKMDHTSILQLLAERFSKDRVGYYSESVNNRREQGINSVSCVLDLLDHDKVRTDEPPVPDNPKILDCKSESLVRCGLRNRNPLQESLRTSALKIVDKYSDNELVKGKSPELFEARSL